MTAKIKVDAPPCSLNEDWKQENRYIKSYAEWDTCNLHDIQSLVLQARTLFFYVQQFSQNLFSTQNTMQI